MKLNIGRTVSSTPGIANTATSKVVKKIRSALTKHGSTISNLNFLEHYRKIFLCRLNQGLGLLELGTRVACSMMPA